MKLFFCNRAFIPIFLFILCVFKSSYSIHFENDSITINPDSSTKIVIVNDSSYKVEIDSVKIVLLEGSILDDVSCSFYDDPNGVYYDAGIKSNIVKENDTLYSLPKYTHTAQNVVYGAVSIQPNSQRKIGEFDIRTGYDESVILGGQGGNYDIGEEYLIRLLFYSNDNTIADIVLRGKNKIYHPTKIKLVKNIINRSKNNIQSQYVNISGRKIGNKLILKAKCVYIRYQKRKGGNESIISYIY